MGGTVSDDKVVSMEQAKKDRTLDHTLIEQLEDALQQAKEGKIKAYALVAIGATEEDGLYQAWHVGTLFHTMTLTGGLHRLMNTLDSIPTEVFDD